ncbi:MAG: hypothetical protein GF398_07465 [Chitinivibrionales bacterium]|nr:hypothetical protein [Chitinivibrionales bacterium]
MRFWRVILLCTAGTALHLLGGCASTRWYPSRNCCNVGAEGYRLEAPKGWMVMHRNEDIILTQHGVSLQNIFIDKQGLDEPLSYSGVHLSQSMFPHQIAEAVIDNFRGTNGVAKVKILSLSPALLDEIEGYRAVVAYRLANGIGKKTAVYGCVYRSDYYELSFSAPVRHYFDNDLETFESVVESFKID